jgi:hypothetical protein
MVSPLGAHSKARTANLGRIQGLSSLQRLYAPLPSVDVSGKSYYHKRLKQSKTIRGSGLFGPLHIRTLQCNTDHIQALTHQHQRVPNRRHLSLWDEHMSVHMRVHTWTVLHTHIHTYVFLVLIITNAVLFQLSEMRNALVLILHTINSGYNLIVWYGLRVCKYWLTSNVLHTTCWLFMSD